MNILKRLFKPSQPSEKERPEKKDPKVSFEVNKDLPLDERFIQNFQLRGGRFLYAVNESEVQQHFDDILMEHDLYECGTIVMDEDFSERFKNYNLKFVVGPSRKECPLFLTSCHFLIADTGTLLFSSRQIKGARIAELPDLFIVLANTSQIVENKTEALTKIKHGSDQIPSNITPLENYGSQDVEEDSFMEYGSRRKLVYLIMIEDL
jgi:hypothetical protein